MSPFNVPSRLEEYDGIRASIISHDFHGRKPDLRKSYMVFADGTVVRIYLLDDKAAVPTNLVSSINFDQPIYGLTAFDFDERVGGAAYSWLVVGFKTHIELIGFGSTINDRFIAGRIDLKRGSKQFHMTPNTLSYDKVNHFLAHYCDEGMILLHNHLGKAYDIYVHNNFAAVHKDKGKKKLPLFRKIELIDIAILHARRPAKLLTWSFNEGDPDNVFRCIYRRDDGKYEFAALSLKVRNFEKYIRNMWNYEITSPITSAVDLPLDYSGSVIFTTNGFELRGGPDAFNITLARDSPLKDGVDFIEVTNGDERCTVKRVFTNFEWEVTAATLIDDCNILVATSSGDVYISTIKLDLLEDHIILHDWTIKKVKGHLEDVVDLMKLDGVPYFVATSQFENLIIKYNSETDEIETVQDISSPPTTGEEEKPTELPSLNFKHWEVNGTHVIVGKNGLRTLKWKDNKLQTVENSESFDLIDDHLDILDIKTVRDRTLVLTRSGLLDEDEPLIGSKIETGLVQPNGNLLYFQDGKINSGPRVISFDENVTTLALYHDSILIGLADGRLIELNGKERIELAQFDGAIILLHTKVIGSSTFIIVITEHGGLHFEIGSPKTFPSNENAIFLGSGPFGVEDYGENSLLVYNSVNLVKIDFNGVGLERLVYLNVPHPIELVFFDKEHGSIIMNDSNEADYIVADPKLIREFDYHLY